MLVTYISGHGYGHMTRACEVLRAVRAHEPALPMCVVGALPESLVRGELGGAVAFRAAACDVGLAQRDALTIDESGTAEQCRRFEASWDAKVAAEARFLRNVGASAVLADIPALAFAAAQRAGVPGIGLGNFSWDWIYRHLARRQPSLAVSAERAASAYAASQLLLELPFAGDLSAFPRRERVGLVARIPRTGRSDARRKLGLDGRPAVLVSFGGIGLPGLDPESLDRGEDLRFVFPGELADGRLEALGLTYSDVVGAVDVVLTKPGYGIITDAIGAGTRVVYTDRGDFPEYPVMVREMPRYLACAHVPSEDLRAGRVTGAVRRVLEQEMPPRPDLGGAQRAAERILAAIG